MTTKTTMPTEYRDTNLDLDLYWKRFSELMTQWHSWLLLTNCETWIMTLRVSDLQSDSDLDSIRNSCDVYAWVVSILIACKQILQLLCARHTTHGCVMWNAVSRLNQTWKWPHFAISNIKYDPRPENCSCFYFGAILCYQGKDSVVRLLLKRKNASLYHKHILNHHYNMTTTKSCMACYFQLITSYF